jgi:hypothetical protein
MREAFSLKRIGIAIVIALAIYGIALGLGSLLYVTDTIGTGATKNDCPDFRHEIADERGIEPEDVPQDDIAAATQVCLDTYEKTPREAFRSEFLFWGIWPGVICAAVFLIWPVWTRILLNQEAAAEQEDAAGGGGQHAPKHV